MSVIQIEKAGAQDRASAFEIFTAPNCHHLLYSKE